MMSEKGYPPLIVALRKHFAKLNPNVDPEVIDWMSYYDPTLTYDELLEVFAKSYPEYKWYETERKPPTKRELEEKEEEETLKVAEYLTETLKEKLPPEEAEAIEKAIEYAKKYKTKYEEFKKKITPEVLKRVEEWEKAEKEAEKMKIVPKPLKTEVPVTELPTFPFKPPKGKEDFYEMWMRAFKGEV